MAAPSGYTLKGMTYDALIQLLIGSYYSDWLRDDERGVSTFKRDLSVTVRSSRDPEERLILDEPWANLGHPAEVYVYELWYGSSFVRDYAFARVDGGRATLPYPKTPKDLTITREQLAIANAVNFHGAEQLDEYLRRVNFSVVD
jgi:hypothetical protein